ncbi:MAG: competence type IV pilus major pilin ComGC [Coriobacteriia bacterium]
MRQISDRGFTLVELMVVVLIIGILVVIAVPIFHSATAEAQRKTCFANQRTIDGAVEMYQAKTENAFVGNVVSGSELVDDYIKAQPACPADSSGACYTVDASGVAGCPNPVSAESHGHY